MSHRNIPQSIGRYEVVERIGHGGMGVVYRARDPRIGRAVAIKLLRVTDEDVRERFLQEARSAGNLKHPNIVIVHDFGEHDDQPYIVMEFVEGTTLAHLIRERAPLSIGRKLELMEELASGLGYAHARGVVHRDVKPANLMIDGENVLRILDFGVARVADSGMTQDGVIMGTPSYMSPEQVHGRPVDRRSDIFAVGLVLYELLSYRQAFPGDSAHVVMNAIATSTPPSLDELCPDLDPELGAIVARAIEKEPDRRFQSMAEIGARLTRIRQRQPREATGESTIVRLSGWTPTKHTPIRATPRSTDRAVLSQRRRELIEAHLAAARTSLDAGDYPAAISRAEQAELIDPDDSRIGALLESAHAARDAHQARQWLDEARACLARDDISGAFDLLGRVEDVAPDLAEARSVRASIESSRQARLERERTARDEAERARVRKERAEQTIAEAESLMVDERFHDALARLKQIDAPDEIAPALQGAIVRAQAGADRVAAARRSAELWQALAATERALATGRIEDAAASLDAARRIDQGDPRLPSLQAMIDAQREKARALRLADETAAKDVAEARSLAQAGHVEDALARLEAATPHELVASAIGEIRELRRVADERAERERQRKAEELRASLQQARQLIDRHGFDEALGLVDRAAATLGETAEVADLRARVQQGLAAVRVKAEHDRRASDAIGKAIKLFGEGRRDAAFAELDAVTPAHPRVTRTIEELRAEVAKSQHRATVDLRVAEARSWFTAGKTAEAIAVLDAIAAEGVENSGARTLRADIVAAEKASRDRAARRRYIEDQIAAARAATEKGHVDEAIRSLEQCRAAVSPGHPAEDLAGDIDAALRVARGRREAGRLLAEARSLLRAGQPHEASASLERAVLLEPAVAGATELAADITAALKAAVDARTRDDAARAAVSRARQAETRGDLNAAAILLANAVAHPIVEAEQVRIDQAIRQEQKRQQEIERQRERETAQRVGQLVKAAKKAMKSDLAHAIELLDAALHEDASHAEARDLRRETVARLFTRLEQSIGAGALDAASGALEDAVRLVPDDSRIGVLRNRLAQTRAAAAQSSAARSASARTGDAVRDFEAAHTIDVDPTAGDEAVQVEPQRESAVSRKRPAIVGTMIAAAVVLLAVVGTMWYVGRPAASPEKVTTVTKSGPQGDTTPAAGGSTPAGPLPGNDAAKPANPTNAPDVTAAPPPDLPPKSDRVTPTAPAGRGRSGDARGEATPAAGTSRSERAEKKDPVAPPVITPTPEVTSVVPSGVGTPTNPEPPPPGPKPSTPNPAAPTGSPAVVPAAPPAPALTEAEAQDVLTAFFARYGAFDIGGLSRIYPQARQFEELRIKALKDNFKTCRYQVRITDVSMKSATVAVVRASVVEACVPKISAPTQSISSLQVFDLQKSAGTWVVVSHFSS